MSPHLPNISTPSGPALRNDYLTDGIAPGCLQFQQALQSLQQHPKSFIHAWLLMAKSLGLSAQSVREHYREGSALPIEQLQAIAILQELPHDQVLAWYGGHAPAGELFMLSALGYTASSFSTVRSRLGDTINDDTLFRARCKRDLLLQT